MPEPPEALAETVTVPLKEDPSGGAVNATEIGPVLITPRSRNCATAVLLASWLQATMPNMTVAGRATVTASSRAQVAPSVLV